MLAAHCRLVCTIRCIQGPRPHTAYGLEYLEQIRLQRQRRTRSRHGDAMVKSGMKDAGYQYVVIDDCWQVSRDAQGSIVADAQRFPHGIKAVADYVHSLGLKFGIYSDAGALTCQKRPAGLGHEYQDARTYASWDVDYLKYDWCNTLPGQDARSSYANIRQALDASGRPIVLSICEWGNASTLAVGQRGRRQSVADNRRHPGPLGRTAEVARRELLFERHARYRRPE